MSTVLTLVGGKMGEPAGSKACRFRMPIKEAPMSKSTCAFGPCERPAQIKGLCGGHYQQHRKGTELKPLRQRASGLTCSVEGCSKSMKSKGLCGSHAMQVKRGKSLTPITSVWSCGRDVPLLEKIELRLDKTGECWLWTGATDTGGYGLVTHQGRRNMKVHRAYLEAIGKPVPEGMTVDHLCRVHACCKPEHLEVVTHQENVLRGIGPTAVNAAKTHCIRGHEFTPENTYWVPSRPNNRNCRACIRIRMKEYRSKARSA